MTFVQIAVEEISLPSKNKSRPLVKKKKKSRALAFKLLRKTHRFHCTLRESQNKTENKARPSRHKRNSQRRPAMNSTNLSFVLFCCFSNVIHMIKQSRSPELRDEVWRIQAAANVEKQVERTPGATTAPTCGQRACARSTTARHSW